MRARKVCEKSILGAMSGTESSTKSMRDILQGEAKGPSLLGGRATTEGPNKKGFVGALSRARTFTNGVCDFIERVYNDMK